MFVGGDVRRRSLPRADKPGAEADGFTAAAYVQAAQMNGRACRYLHTQFLLYFPSKRSQLCLACLDVSAGQIPNARVRAAVRTPVDEQYLTFANQRRDDDLGHGWIRAWPSDQPNVLNRRDPREGTSEVTVALLMTS